jgi:hypothetical protein
LLHDDVLNLSECYANPRPQNSAANHAPACVLRSEVHRRQRKKKILRCLSLLVP